MANSQRMWCGSSVTVYWIVSGCCPGTRSNAEAALPMVQVRPSKSHSTGPRQYICAVGGGGVWNSTRNATSSDSPRLARSPGDMLSLRPVTPVEMACGKPNTGP